MRETLDVDATNSELLSSSQVASFVCDGYVDLGAVVPAGLNDRVLAELSGYDEGTGSSYWRSSSAVRDVFAVGPVAGALRSLLGPAPFYDHSVVHTVPAHSPGAQQWHADSVIDTRSFRFDLLVLYYPQDTPEEMGPTLILPGSHLRQVRYGSIAHYRNIVGQRRLACRAGTIVLTHANLWHCAQPNSTDRPRYMFKLRVEPSGGQRGWFATDGSADPSLLETIYRSNHSWQGSEHREEQILRAKFWRYLAGDNTLDAADGQLARLAI